MRTALAVSLAFLMMYAPLVQCQDNSYGELLSPEQLDNLLAPIALYPDPLLAQVLLAATFPDQIDEAARFLRAQADPNYIDSEPWDVSVKAVAHYPTVLYRMADKLDWTTALGQAYVNQSTDVMASVQRLREEARSVGNLVTTPQQEVVESGGYIQIWPEQPQVIYVPVYDPAIVYFGRGGGSFISFGVGFAIGAWLNHDCDWRDHRIFYHGWEDGGGWVQRSRPYVHATNIYVSNNYRNVVVNRTVVNRPINYSSLNRYNSVHREVNYNNVRGGSALRDRPLANTGAEVNNKIIRRNIDTNDPRINAYRGRPSQQEQASRPEMNRPEVARPQPSRQEQVQVRPPGNRPEPVRPAYQPPARGSERPEAPAFSGNRGGFDAHAASQRGQASRIEARQPAPPSRQQSAPASHESERKR